MLIRYLTPGTGAPAPSPVTLSVGDAPEFHQVPVREFARNTSLAAKEGRATRVNHLADHRVALAQAGNPGSAPDPRHSAHGDPSETGARVRAQRAFSS